MLLCVIILEVMGVVDGVVDVEVDGVEVEVGLGVVGLVMVDVEVVVVLKKNSSHLSVHLVNRLLSENRKSIPKTIKGKNLLKNVTLQILNFILIS